MSSPCISHWQEVIQVKEENRYELHLSGIDISKKLETSLNTLPKLLYEQVQLNFLEISDTCLEDIDEEIGQLFNLVTLTLCRNSLNKIPPSICQLEKLKFLDLSSNNLTQIPFQLSLQNLISLNLGNNNIESIQSIEEMKNLVVCHLENNKLTHLPHGFGQLLKLSELYVSNNLLEVLPAQLGSINGLKVLDVSSNKLKVIEPAVVGCSKLKKFDITNNPLSDNRLKKMAKQCSAKALLDYIKKCGQNMRKDDTKKVTKGKENHLVGDNRSERKIIVLQDKNDKRCVIAEQSVINVRPYICCLLLKQLDLRDEAIFKKFLAIQTKLHDNICEMRTKATIATHCADKLVFPLTYLATDIKEIKIVALGKTEQSTAGELIATLIEERDELKKKKKRQPKTGLYKYIELVEREDNMAYLRTANDDVISLPPITNSELTKVNNEITDVFVEVTSPVNIGVCKRVMESLIEQLYSASFNCIHEKDDCFQGLLIEPLRVVDNVNHDLRCIFPSKIDLQFTDVIRIQKTAE